MDTIQFTAYVHSEKYNGRKAWFSFTTKDMNGAWRCTLTADYIPSDFFEIPYEDLMLTINNRLEQWKQQL